MRFLNYVMFRRVFSTVILGTRQKLIQNDYKVVLRSVNLPTALNESMPVSVK